MSGPLLFLLVALIALAGSFVQSTTGFGYAVTCMALWPLLLPFKTATVVELITATFMTVTIAVRYWKFIKMCIRDSPRPGNQDEPALFGA